MSVIHFEGSRKLAALREEEADGSKSIFCTGLRWYQMSVRQVVDPDDVPEDEMRHSSENVRKAMRSKQKHVDFERRLLI